ncbi:wax ester/triacylglycerol synthase domain-containing protein [Paractinoplanes durhamensis]|uniref:wax ester/triacylglycerol synthase domain-containing protein n=1 Tax=Paractinoplanes durhamensis TaxID=113563 RepID=UPI0036280501
MRGSARRADRGVPRLRQRLVRPRFGGGPAVWAGDTGFDVRRHLSTAACPSPGDERALLDAAMPYLLAPLPRDRPLWRAVLLTGISGGGSALVLVAHHALSDGMGGLAALARLVDGADVPVGRTVESAAGTFGPAGEVRRGGSVGCGPLCGRAGSRGSRLPRCWRPPVGGAGRSWSGFRWMRCGWSRIGTGPASTPFCSWWWPMRCGAAR